MKNTKLFLVMAALMAMVTLFSCEKVDVEPVEHHTANQAMGVREIAPDDELIKRTYKDKRERFVEGGIEYSFIHVDIYKNAGEVPDTTRRYWIRPISHVGVEPQYFHISDTTFVTTRGQETVLEVQETTDGSWKAYASSKNQLWDAKNKSGNEFAHATTTSSARVVYTLNDENNIKGYTVEFDVPEWTLNEKTLPFEEVSGVFYDGKSWDAIKYESEITSTFKIADALVMSGETSTKDLLVSNLAFFLKHVIDSKIEKLAYEGKFYAKNNVVDTETERVVGSLVTRDNGDIVESKDFELGMRLFLSLSQPQDQKVNSEKELMDTGSNHNRGNVTDTPMSSDVFTGKKFAGQDSITLSDGVVVNAPFGWEGWSWGAEQLPYAEIVDRQVSVKSVKNEQLSNNSTLVYTVTVTMSVKVGFVGINRAAETYEASVSYNRSYNLPDDYSTEFEQTDYVLSLQNENASKLSTKDQHNTIRTVVKNRGEVSSTSEAVYPLSLYASVAGGDTVKVDKPFKPSVISIEDHADKGEWKNAKDANGFDVRWVKDSQTIRIKGGNVMEYEWYHEIQGRNNKDIYDHAEVKGVSASDVSFSEPVLVDSTKTGNSITKVYRVDAQFTPTVTSTASVQTKAGNTNVNSLAVAASFYQMVVEGDKYIDGQDEVEWYTRTNGNVIEVGGRLYEHYTISGKVLVDEQQTTMEPTLKGVDAEDVIVDNADGYSLTGNGLNKTGNGNYNNYLTKGNSSYPYTFNYNAPASATVKLNGRSGKGASKTFNASFVIKDGSLTSGASSQSNGYTVYPKTSNVKGTYTVEDKTVELTAQATRNLKVKIPTDDFVSDRIVKTVTKNGNSINYNVKLYETWSISGEKLKDEKSGTLTPSLTGSNGGDIVVKNVNFTTSGNGYNGTGNGTYTDNASNGENSFSNSYSWSAPASVTVNLNGTKGTKTETISTTWTIAEAGQKIGTTTANGGYNVYPYTNTVKGTYTVEDKTVELTANATKNLKVEIPQDTFVSDRIVKTVTKNGNSVNYNVKLYETWSISGEKLKDEKSGTLTPSLTGSNGGDIVVKNTNFTTSGNGHNGTGNGTYTDNASNGENSFSNSYSWSAPASVTVNLNGTKGTKTETISTSWVIAEAGQNIGNKVAETGYDVYPYTNTVKGTYTVDNESVELTAQATKSLKVKREIPKIIPDEWGKIKSAGFSAVPSHLDANGNYVDGSNAQTATSCMTIVTDKGAVPVLFGWADQDPRVPTTAQILASPFTTGTYTADYNSAYYNNGWVPAIAKDTNTGISYSIPGVPDIRFVRNESLVMWGWRGGNYSTVLPGYTCMVEDGTLTVTYNGQVVLELR